MLVKPNLERNLTLFSDVVQRLIARINLLILN